MTMPQIPEGKHRPSLEETVIDLLESIALEEIAISHLINTEAEKNQAIICKYFNNEKQNGLHNGIQEIIICGQNTSKLMDSIIIKEWLLFRKLETTLEIGLFRKEERSETVCNKQKDDLCLCCNCQNNRNSSCNSNMCGINNDCQGDVF